MYWSSLTPACLYLIKLWSEKPTNKSSLNGRQGLSLSNSFLQFLWTSGILGVVNIPSSGFSKKWNFTYWKWKSIIQFKYWNLNRVAGSAIACARYLFLSCNLQFFLKIERGSQIQRRNNLKFVGVQLLPSNCIAHHAFLGTVIFFFLSFPISYVSFYE